MLRVERIVVDDDTPMAGRGGRKRRGSRRRRRRQRRLKRRMRKVDGTKGVRQRAEAILEVADQVDAQADAGARRGRTAKMALGAALVGGLVWAAT